MLVLRRKAGEAIVLNNVIRIVILSVDRYRIKIGIEAPPDVVIVREELLSGDDYATTEELLPRVVDEQHVER